MKIKIMFVLSMLILCFNLNAVNQEMGDLYKYVIEDYYNESLKEGYISEQDTLYLFWCLYDCSENCIEYNVHLDNDKIQFNKMPKLDENHLSASVLRLCMPELESQFILIQIIPFNPTYNTETGVKQFIRSSTIFYKFKYNKTKSKYVFYSKKEYGI
jgi:hypothetical protein